MMKSRAHPEIRLTKDGEYGTQERKQGSSLFHVVKMEYSGIIRNSGSADR
jgi:hypothetical protein